MSFYPDKKDGMSPSAIAQWLNGRGAFVKSYFVGERGPETKSMQTGTQIHALIEAGIITAKHVYPASEMEVSVQISEGRVFRGRPDSHETGAKTNAVRFVDYKTGKANNWKEKLPTDMKMKATAWLVWKATDEPKKVEGFVEFFQTTWDPESKQVVLIEGQESEVMAITYTAAELKEFTQVILKAMDDVNVFYEKWLTSSGDFVSKADVARYAELKEKSKALDLEMDEIAERILGQMDFGGEENHKVEGVGSFFVKTTETWDYPADLPVNTDTGLITLEQAENIIASAKAAQKSFTLINEPKTVTRKVNFRPAKEK